jgi:nitric oxide reductase large subunit
MAETRKMDLSRWWLRASVATFTVGFAVLGWLAYASAWTARRSPTAWSPRTGASSSARGRAGGQQVFQRNALMQYGTLFGHGAYLGPDFTARHLHRRRWRWRPSTSAPGSRRRRRGHGSRRSSSATPTIPRPAR